jgi:2-polyprenyl-6-methoxyphenol hydroxylase-like FAD-dependent oxidoreductase
MFNFRNQPTITEHPQSFPMSPIPSIAIIGAGPGGLTLARLLHINNLSCTVFENDASPNSRSQGGTLDLHPESGQSALKAAGLFDRFQELMRFEGEAFRLADKSGHLYINTSADEPKGRRPEIDRIQLRQLLLDSVPAENIRWGWKVKSIEKPDADGRWGIAFTDNTKPSEFFDLVVGADGAWSKVRAVLSDVQPFYSGVSGLDFRFGDVDINQPKIAQLVGRGSYFAYSDSKGLLGQRNGDGSIRCYVMMRTPENWLTDCGIDFSNPAETKTEILNRYYNDWDDSLKDLVRLADDDIISRKLFMLPIGFQWVSKQGITLLGDAAHLMTPFAGVGVNLAMHDALDLATAIVARKNDWEAKALPVDREDLAVALRSYEAEMLKRAESNATKTWENLELCFRDDAPVGFMERINGYFES